MLSFTQADLDASCAVRHLSVHAHPSWTHVRLYNYTQRAQYESAWSPQVLASRGLILGPAEDDGTLNIIARPFPKFFNVFEMFKQPIPDHIGWEAYNKVDGSMGVAYCMPAPNGYFEWRIATRGRFDSPQAVVATEMLQALNTSSLDTAYTYIFEIVYPENRIIVDYGERRELVLLGAIRRDDATELTYEELCSVAAALGACPVVERFACSDKPFESWAAVDTHMRATYGAGPSAIEAEGMVIRLMTKDGHAIRAKWKYPAYTTLHKAASTMSNVSVWEHLRDGTMDVFLDVVLDVMPDEAHGAIRRAETDIRRVYDTQRAAVQKLWDDTLPDVMADPRQRAAAFRAHGEEYSRILFALCNGKKELADKLVWGLAKPVVHVNFSKFNDGDDA